MQKCAFSLASNFVTAKASRFPRGQFAVEIVGNPQTREDVRKLRVLLTIAKQVGARRKLDHMSAAGVCFYFGEGNNRYNGQFLHVYTINRRVEQEIVALTLSLMLLFCIFFLAR